MASPEQLLRRLDDIGQSLARTGDGVALIGLGSVGLETARLDAYSDLDFFVVVRAGAKPSFLADLSWLSSVCPLAYAFMNTQDGYKALFEDNIFTEFAVFEPAELEHIPFAPGRLVWAAEDVDPQICLPRMRSDPPQPHTREWIIGEALTNLYVGMGRYRRGEKLSAMRFIQGYAVDRLMELAPYLESELPAYRDAFTAERRFEQRFPRMAARLADWLRGYDDSPESARSIMDFLEQQVGADTKMCRAIRQLIDASE